MGKSNDGSSLGDRMKQYEEDFNQRVPYNEHLIIRLDGHKFSKFTKGLDRPYDVIFRDAMVKTTEDLCKEFGAVTGYTQSDEISLVIPMIYKQHELKIEDLSELYEEIGDELDDDEELYVYAIHKETKEKYWCYHQTTCMDREERCTELCLSAEKDTVDAVYFEDRVIYGAQSSKQYGNIGEAFDDFDYFYYEIDNNQIFSGRCQKIASLASAFCTLRFNENLKNTIKEQMDPMAEYYSDNFYVTDDEVKFHEKCNMYNDKVGKAWFDARIFGVKTAEEAFNAVMWRVRDSEKNARSMFSSTYMSHKKLLNLNGLEQTALTLKETGNDYNDMPESFKYGTFIKKESYMKDIDFRDLNYKDRTKFNTPDMPQVERSRYVSLTKDITTFSDASVEFVMTKKIQETK